MQSNLTYITLTCVRYVLKKMSARMAVSHNNTIVAHICSGVLALVHLGRTESSLKVGAPFSPCNL